jgi:hypothetical protein
LLPLDFNFSLEVSKRYATPRLSIIQTIDAMVQYVADVLPFSPGRALFA